VTVLKRVPSHHPVMKMDNVIARWESLERSVTHVRLAIGDTLLLDVLVSAIFGEYAMHQNNKSPLNIQCKYNVMLDTVFSCRV